MAYTADQLSMLVDTIGGRGPRIWQYWSDDSVATILGSGYISDAGKKRMSVGDIVWVFRGTYITVGPDQSPSTVAGGTVSEFAATPTWGLYVVSAVSSGAATLQVVTTQLDGAKWQIGQATSALVGFFGTTPISQRVSATLTATASLFATTGASYVAQTSATVSGVFGFTSVNVAALFDALQEIRATLVAYGLHKGGA